MKPTETLLRRQPDCPGIDTLASYAESPDQAANLRPHIEVCANCQTEIQLLNSFLEAKPAEHELAAPRQIAGRLPERFASPKAAPAASGAWWTGWRVWAPTLSMLLLIAVGLGWQRQREASDTAPVYRDVPRIEVYIPKQGDQIAFPEFRWQAVPAAATYSWTLTEVDGTVALAGASPTASLSLDARTKGLLLPRKTLRFSVEALDGAGKTIARSASLRIRIEPTTPQAPK